MEYELVELNTARNCLRYVIRAFHIKQIYLPYYICPTVRSAIQKEKIEIVYYHIDKDFKPVFDFPLNAYIIYPNYFGICSKIVEELSEKYKNLIVDNAHSFYSKPLGIASFCSLRKFFPTIKDGAFLYTTKTINFKIQKSQFEYEQRKMTYEDVCKNENRLDSEEILLIGDCSKKYFNNLDIAKDNANRIKRFKYWHEKLEDKNLLDINIRENDYPFSYPFLAKTSQEADELVAKLDMPIYRYWNNMPESFEEKIFYTNLVSIILV